MSANKESAPESGWQCLVLLPSSKVGFIFLPSEEMCASSMCRAADTNAFKKSKFVEESTVLKECIVKNRGQLEETLKGITASSLTLYFTGYGGYGMPETNRKGVIYLCLSDTEIVYIDEVVNWLRAPRSTPFEACWLFFELCLTSGQSPPDNCSDCPLVLPSCKNFTIAVSGLVSKEDSRPDDFECAYWTTKVVDMYKAALPSASIGSILSTAMDKYWENNSGEKVFSSNPMFTSLCCGMSKKKSPVVGVVGTSSNKSATITSTHSPSSSKPPAPVEAKPKCNPSVDSSPTKEQLLSALSLLKDVPQSDWKKKFAQPLLFFMKREDISYSYSTKFEYFVDKLYDEYCIPTWSQVIQALDQPTVMIVKGVKVSDKVREYLRSL